MMEKATYNKNYYNIFKVCLDFRQRVVKMQRLSKKTTKKKNER